MADELDQRAAWARKLLHSDSWRYVVRSLEQRFRDAWAIEKSAASREAIWVRLQVLGDLVGEIETVAETLGDNNGE